MTNRKDGGAAFPHSHEVRIYDIEGYEEIVHQENGISYRDLAALKALQGMLSHSTRYRPRLPDDHDPRNPPKINWHESIAQEAYQIADAMLAEREKAGSDE